MKHYRPMSTTLPTLPLLLWRTPPGLELALGQEGVAFRKVRDPHPLAFQSGRFVLYDSRVVSSSSVRERLSPDHVPLDVDVLRRGEPVDPFLALTDARSMLGCWDVAGHRLTERLARHPKAAIRRRVVSRLRRAVTTAGGVWARLAPFPFPFRSAFNFRADLDENVPEDYVRFARARRPLADCSTHFVSTRAYGEEPEVLRDLLGYDTQSHGHHHVVYRERSANRRNLLRAHESMRRSGFEPSGFAAPHGRWNPGLDRELEELGYLYSSDFQLGYDDLPFHPWRGDRFSSVLQVPIHPICEGSFFEAGARSGRLVGAYLAGVVRAKVDAGEPAFVYGHPERRLGRCPEVLEALADAVAGQPLLWRVTLTEFARWWRWRASRSWSLVPRGDDRLEIQFDDWSGEYPLALEVVRGRHVAALPLRTARTPLRLEELAYELRPERAGVPEPIPASRPLSLRRSVREAIDWETVTPTDELPVESLTGRFKKGLRWWRDVRLAGAPS